MNKIIPLHGYASEINQAGLSEAEMAIGFNANKSAANIYVGNGTGYVKVGDGTIASVAGDTVSLTVNDNTEYRLAGGASGTANEGVVTSLSITIPAIILNNYAAVVHFSTGTLPTCIAYSDDILLIGEDISVTTVNNETVYVFDVQANTRYTIAFEYDGTYMRGYVAGVELPTVGS